MKPMLMNKCDSQLPRVLLTHGPFRSAVVLFITYLLSTSRCGPGFFCSEGTRHKAPVGSYIPNSGVASKKAATPCPGGTFGNVEGMMKPECSGSCTQGYFCPAGSTTPTANDCIRGNEARAGGVAVMNSSSSTPTDVYCPPGASAPVAVSPGYYTLPAAGPDSARNRYKQEICETG